MIGLKSIIVIFYIVTLVFSDEGSNNVLASADTAEDKFFLYNTLSEEDKKTYFSELTYKVDSKEKKANIKVDCKDFQCKVEGLTNLADQEKPLAKTALQTAVEKYYTDHDISFFNVKVENDFFTKELGTRLSKEIVEIDIEKKGKVVLVKCITENSIWVIKSKASDNNLKMNEIDVKKISDAIKTPAEIKNQYVSKNSAFLLSATASIPLLLLILGISISV